MKSHYQDTPKQKIKYNEPKFKVKICLATNFLVKMLYATNKLCHSACLCTPSGNPKLTLWLSLSVLHYFSSSPKWVVAKRELFCYNPLNLPHLSSSKAHTYGALCSDNCILFCYLCFKGFLSNCNGIFFACFDIF